MQNTTRTSSSHGQNRLQISCEVFKLLPTPGPNEIPQVLHICQQRSKKIPNHTSNSHAKLTLQSSFSLFHDQFTNKTALQIHGGMHWSSRYCTILPFTYSCDLPPCPLPVLALLLLSCTADLYSGYQWICLLLSKGMGQQGSNNHLSLHNERMKDRDREERVRQQQPVIKKSCLATVESTEASKKLPGGWGTWTKNSGASGCFQKENLKNQLELLAPCSCTKN